MVILKATSFLEGHNRDMGMTCSITRIRVYITGGKISLQLLYTFVDTWSGIHGIYVEGSDPYTHTTQQ
jgi:hypothetical protein